MGKMTCTRCFRPTHCEPPSTQDIPVSVVVSLCINWLCDDCLAEDENDTPAVDIVKGWSQ